MLFFSYFNSSLALDDTNSTWSWITIINSSPWINKEVFDLVTIKEIFQYEALIMLFILLYTFFNRVIGKKQKRQYIKL